MTICHPLSIYISSPAFLLTIRAVPDLEIRDHIEPYRVVRTVKVEAVHRNHFRKFRKDLPDTGSERLIGQQRYLTAFLALHLE